VIFVSPMKTTLTISIEEALKEQLDLDAKKNHRSVSGEVTRRILATMQLPENGTDPFEGLEKPD
jgi:plasmid stability protein